MSTEQKQAIRHMLTRPRTGDRSRTIEEQRAGFAAMMSAFVVPQGVSLTDIELAGRRAVLVEPEGEARPGTILYLHGGSFAQGSPETAMSLTAHLVLRTGMRAISFDYRLAPEHPFPAGVEDCAAAYRELVARGEGPESIAVVGDSAGGALSVTTAVSARQQGVPVPACVVCFSPGGNALRSGGSLDSRRDKDPFFTAEALKASGERYLQGADPRDEFASPVSRADLTGFPPLLVQVGGDEILLDDSVLLTERAREADVDVVLDVTAGAPHVFQAFVDQLDEAGQALDRAALFLTQHVAGG